MIHASKTRELSSEVKKLRSQLLLGMQQQKLVYEGESKARLAEIRTLQGQLKVLHDQNRLTNDDIREKARKYPELEFEIEARMFDFTEERDRRRKLQRKYRALKEKVRAVGIDAGSSRLLGSQDSDAGEHNQANLLSMAELGYMTNNRPRPASRSSVSSGDESSSSEEEFATESGDGEGKEREPAGTLRASFIPDSDQESDDDEDEEEQASGQENSMEGKIMDPVQANAIVPGQADPDVMLCKWGADEAGGPCGLVATSQEVSPQRDRWRVAVANRITSRRKWRIIWPNTSWGLRAQGPFVASLSCMLSPQQGLVMLISCGNIMYRPSRVAQQR